MESHSKNDESALGAHLEALAASDLDHTTIPTALKLIQDANRAGAKLIEAEVALFIFSLVASNSDVRLLLLAKSVLSAPVEVATEGDDLPALTAANVLQAAAWIESRAPTQDPILGLKKSRELLRVAESVAAKIDERDRREKLVCDLRWEQAKLVVDLHDLGHVDAASAVDLFTHVLEYRTFERDSDSWADAMLNLGGAKARVETQATGSASLAGVESYQESIRGFEAANNTDGHSLALYRAGADMAAYFEANEDGFEAFVDAIQLATEALRLARVGEDKTLLADCLSLMCVLADLADQDPEEFASEALQYVSPEKCSGLVLKAAAILGSIRFDSEQWRGAGEAFQFAADGHRNRSAASARNLLRGNELVGEILCQWAAYAWIRAGHLEQAVETTEIGANRDLKVLIERRSAKSYIDVVRSHDAASADVLENELLNYRSLILDTQVSGANGEPSPPLWNTLVNEIWDRHGIEKPFAGFDLDEFATRLNDGEALCVVSTSPAGTAGVVISLLDGVPQLAALHSAALTSDVVAELVLGGEAIDDEDFDLDDQDLIVEHAWSVGESAGEFLTELRTILLEREISALVLVSTGQNALLPWHCVPFGDGGQLIDDFEISHAPSASIFAECRSRARDRSIETAIVMADPVPHVVPLTATRREADLLQSTASTVWFDIRIGHEATVDTFVEQYGLYDLVHLAVNGRSLHMSGRANSGLSLANDSEIGWSKIASLDSELAPVVVLSACQAGIVQAYSDLDRQFSLAQAFLVAGASGVVLRLWPVDDDATAILMTKFYVLLGDDQTNPRRCLHEAQLWMRSATVKEIASVAGRGLKRAASARAKQLDGDAPYADIDLWASFVYVGA